MGVARAARVVGSRIESTTGSASLIHHSRKRTRHHVRALHAISEIGIEIPGIGGDPKVKSFEFGDQHRIETNYMKLEEIICGIREAWGGLIGAGCPQRESR